VERVLPSPEVKERLGDLAVGLAADCDAPESDVEKLMNDNLKGATMLPFAAFVTHDGKWVGGFSGNKDATAFLKVLDAAEQSPLIQATEATRKKLAGLADKATKAAEAGDWKVVATASREAAKTTGRCAERKTLAALRKNASAWASGRLDEAVASARSGDVAKAQLAIADVRKQLAGEPEAADADMGTKALKRLAAIPAGDAGARNREKAAEEHRETRWAAIFEPAPAAEPKKEPEPDEGGIEEGGG
jgi:hypothetical protein